MNPTDTDPTMTMIADTISINDISIPQTMCGYAIVDYLAPDDAEHAPETLVVQHNSTELHDVVADHLEHERPVNLAARRSTPDGITLTLTTGGVSSIHLDRCDADESAYICRITVRVDSIAIAPNS